MFLLYINIYPYLYILLFQKFIVNKTLKKNTRNKYIKYIAEQIHNKQDHVTTWSYTAGTPKETLSDQPFSLTNQFDLNVNRFLAFLYCFITLIGIPKFHRLALPACKSHITGTTQCVLFEIWLLSFNGMPVRVTHDHLSAVNFHCHIVHHCISACHIYLSCC